MVNAVTPECKILFPELGEYRACFRATPDPDKRWISIQDELPPKNAEVLFCCLIDDGNPNGDYFTDVEKGVWDIVHFSGKALVMDHSDGFWSPCTHWMPLPSTPRVPE